MVELGGVIEDCIKKCNGDEPNLVRVMRLVELGKKEGFEDKFRVRWHNSELMPWGNLKYPLNVEGHIVSNFDVAGEVLKSGSPGLFHYKKDPHSKRTRYIIYKKQEG